MRARFAELEESSKTKLPKKRAKCRTTDVELVAEQAVSERAKHYTWTAKLDAEVYELKGKLKFWKCCNSVAVSRHSLLGDECNYQICQIASDRV